MPSRAAGQPARFLTTTIRPTTASRPGRPTARLAFSSSRSGDLDIYLLDLANGAVQRVTDDPAHDYEPDWSPDGHSLAFVSDRDGIGNLYVLDLRSSALPRAGTWNRGLQDPSWTPTGGLLSIGPWADGRRFNSAQGVLINTVGVSVSVALVGSSHGYAEPAWSASAVAPAAAAEHLLPGRVGPTASAPIDSSVRVGTLS
jgi:TolB protein